MTGRHQRLFIGHCATRAQRPGLDSLASIALNHTMTYLTRGHGIDSVFGPSHRARIRTRQDSMRNSFLRPYRVLE
ncbi:hypothetical protein RRG08_056074 [Elysia crispata]|uniref:Uncharacterized protein n=1 Tax=Elysia crispata TaxID=231223 RepID=A0AAE0ZBV2_9GAST|nr:hypothetical protein RRG08_056074 [Elysia crispata]